MAPGLEERCSGTAAAGQCLEPQTGPEPEKDAEKIIQWAGRMRLPGALPLARHHAE